MCGIAGGVFWGRTIAPARAEHSVELMVAALAHRGPDGRGLYCSDPARLSDSATPLVILGHTRLAILDVTEAGAQPMGGHDGQPCIT